LPSVGFAPLSGNYNTDSPPLGQQYRIGFAETSKPPERFMPHISQLNNLGTS